jgi:hypothetical protein
VFESCVKIFDIEESAVIKFDVKAVETATEVYKDPNMYTVMTV